MNVMTSRFGSLNVQESDVVRLTEGLVGFRSSTQFLLLADQKVDGLYWLQSLDTPELAFALVTPGEGLEDYHVDVRAGDRAALALDDCQEPEVFLILNRNEAGVLTVNLQGPMVFNRMKFCSQLDQLLHFVHLPDPSDKSRIHSHSVLSRSSRSWSDPPADYPTIPGKLGTGARDKSGKRGQGWSRLSTVGRRKEPVRCWSFHVTETKVSSLAMT